MDNASQALLIATSVLLAVLLFAALLTMKDKISAVKSEENMQKLIEQNKEYNAKYEAYNKNFMYGTDIISLVSLAYNNNLKANQENDNDYASDHYVEVEINLGGEDLKDRFYYYFVINGEEVSRTPYSGGKNNVTAIPGNATMCLSEGTKFIVDSSIPEPVGVNYNSNMENLLNVSSGPEKKSYTKAKLKDGTISKYYLKYSYVTDFKRRAFACTDVEYSASTGRISKMVFDELDLTDYDTFSSGYKK